ASDAADKLRFAALANNALYESEPELKVRIAVDKAARTITVSDNGIGMSRAEVIQNIGIIAKSGTREFFQQLTGDQAKDASLIGQFGVGFYSAFIVADRVTLTTRRAGLTAVEGVRWESDGRGSYTLEAIEQPDRGTTVVLHLREGEDDLISEYRLRSIIQHPRAPPSRLPACTARARAPTSTRCCCSSRPGHPSTCGSPRPAGASSCTSGGSSCWKTPAS